MDRLAPDREGPVATGRRLHRLTPAERARSPTTWSPTPTSSRPGPGPDYTADQIANGSKACSTRSPRPARSPARRRSGRTPTCGTSRPTSTAPGSPSRASSPLEVKDPELAKTLTDRFAELQTLLDQYRIGDGFVFYDDLTHDQVKELSDAVNALSEPLSELTAAVVL